jgi:hypothetical protein
VGRPQLGPKANQTVDAALWQILDVNLFRQLPLTRDEFCHETSTIGISMKFCFQPYIERPKPTQYAIWASVLLHTASDLRTGLELELLLASTSGTRTGSTLDLLLDLETLVGLLLLHKFPHQIQKSKVPKTPQKTPREGSENHHREQHNKALRNHAESSPMEILRKLEGKIGKQMN